MIAESVQIDRAQETAPAYTDQAADAYRVARVAHWNSVSKMMQRPHRLSGHYRGRLIELFRFLCPPGKRVLELGCAQGDLLAALEPGYGVGVDFSPEMIQRAGEKHPDLKFVEQDVRDLKLDETFDVIILSDLVNDLWDVQETLTRVRRHCTPRTRVILNFYSRLWELPLSMAQSLGFAKPNLPQNWLTVEDVRSLLLLADFQVIRTREEILLPSPIPLLSDLANRYLVKLWPFRI